VSYTNLYGCINKKGKYVITPEYDMFNSFKNNIALVKQISHPYKVKYGFIDRSGKQVTPIIYSEADEFSDGVALVSIENEYNQTKYFYIDQYGNKTGRIQYELAYSYHDSSALVRKNGSYRLIDRNEKILSSRLYDIAEDFSLPYEYNNSEYNNSASSWPYALVSLNGFWGAIDRKGNEIIPPIYDSIGKTFTSFICKKDDEYFTIDFNGKTSKIENKTNTNILNFNSYTESSLDQSFYYNSDYFSANNMIRQPNYLIKSDTVSALKYEYYGINFNAKRSPINDKFALFNSGFDTQISDYEYDNFYIVSTYNFIGVKGDSIVILQKKENDFYPIKSHFKVLLKDIHNYDVDASPRFFSPYSRVRFNNRWGVLSDIKNLQSIIVPFKFDDIGFLPETISHFIPVKQNGKWGFFDIRKSSLGLQFQYDQIGYFSKPNLWQVKLNGKWSFITEKNNRVSNLTFDDATNFSTRNLCGIKIANKWGYINEHFEWAVKPVFDKIGLVNIDNDHNLALLNNMIVEVAENGKIKIFINANIYYMFIPH
jgi:hypothetical protein